MSAHLVDAEHHTDTKQKRFLYVLIVNDVGYWYDNLARKYKLIDMGRA